MEPNSPESDENVLLSKEQIHTRLLERIWNIVQIIAVLAGTASIMRYRVTGWLTIYTVHAALVAMFTTAWIFRHKLSFNSRVLALLLLFYTVSILGLFTMGLLSAGIWWLILAVLMANIFYSTRTGILHAAFSLGIILAAGIAATTGYLSIPFDANDYIADPATWVTLTIGCVFLSLFIFSAITTYQRAILNLLNEVDKSRQLKAELIDQYEKAQAEIKKLQDIIPICASCKKVRDDKGYWDNVESYMQKATDLQFSHGICPDCGERLYGQDWVNVCKIAHKQ